MLLLEIKTWTREHADIPCGLSCGRGERKHKTLGSFCSDSRSDATPGACCILYISRLPWARQFKLHNPIQMQECKQSLRGLKELGSSCESHCVKQDWPLARAYIINLKSAASHVFIYEPAEIRQGSCWPLGQPGPLLYITVSGNDRCTGRRIEAAKNERNYPLKCVRKRANI